MMKFLPSILVLLLFSLDASAIELNMLVEHEVSAGKVYFKGKTNLPPGTKIGVNLSASSDGYSAQSYNIIIEKDGAFVSEGFTNKGRPLSGNYTAEVIAYANGAWQNRDIIEKLREFTGHGIESGKMRIEYPFLIGSASASHVKLSDQSDPLKHGKLVQDFCYALQASIVCKDLNMRADTERKIESQVGQKIRGSKSPYNQDCLIGFSKAFEDENKGICSKAWKLYGCYGSMIPRLIQENPFRKRNGIFCEY